MVSEDKEALFYELKNVMGLTKLLGTGETIVPLSDEEVDFLIKFDGEEQMVEMSEGIIEMPGDCHMRPKVERNEGLIKKIDRHKRKAWLEIEMFGRTIEMQVGLK